MINRDVKMAQSIGCVEMAELVGTPFVGFSTEPVFTIRLRRFLEVVPVDDSPGDGGSSGEEVEIANLGFSGQLIIEEQGGCGQGYDQKYCQKKECSY